MIKDIEDELSKIYAKLDELSTALKNQQNWPPYLKTDQACKYLSCSPTTLREICIDYNVLPQKKRGVNYYVRADIDRIFAGRN